MTEPPPSACVTPAAAGRHPFGDINSNRELPAWNEALSLTKAAKTPQSAFKGSVGPAQRTPFPRQATAQPIPARAPWSTGMTAGMQPRGRHVTGTAAPGTKQREPCASALWDLPNANTAEFWIRKAMQLELQGDHEGARQAFLDARKRRAAPAADLRSALQEFEERAAGHQPSLQQTSPADMAEDGKVMSETHAQGLQEDPVQDAEHRQPSQAKGVRFDDADITLAAATPPAGRKSICNTDAGSTPYVPSTSRSRNLAGSFHPPCGSPMDIDGMGWNEGSQHNPLEDYGDATPQTMTARLVAPVLQDAILAMSKDGSAEATQEADPSLPSGLYELTVPPGSAAEAELQPLTGDCRSSVDQKTQPLVLDITNSFAFEGAADDESTTPNILAFERTKPSSIADEDDAMSVPDLPPHDDELADEDLSPPDTAHKFQNPLYGTTPPSLAGSESGFCLVDAYTPATAAKQLALDNTSGSKAGESAHAGSSPLTGLVRRVQFDSPIFEQTASGLREHRTSLSSIGPSQFTASPELLGYSECSHHQPSPTIHAGASIIAGQTELEGYESETDAPQSDPGSLPGPLSEPDGSSITHERPEHAAQQAAAAPASFIAELPTSSSSSFSETVAASNSKQSDPSSLLSPAASGQAGHQIDICQEEVSSVTQGSKEAIDAAMSKQSQPSTAPVAPPPGRTTCAADLTALAGRTPSPSPQFADSTRQVARASMEKLSVMYEELTLNSPQPGKESLTVGDAGATIPNTPHGGTPLHGDEAEAMESEEQDTIAALKGPATPQGAKVGAFAGAPASKTPTSALRQHSMATPSGDAAPSSISKPIRVATPGSARPSVGKREIKALLESHGGKFDHRSYGSRSQLSPVTTASRFRPAGDQPQIVTPVRRSVRKATTPVDAGSMLRRTGFTYTPNRAMDPRLDPNVSLDPTTHAGDTTRASLFADSPSSE